MQSPYPATGSGVIAANGAPMRIELVLCFMALTAWFGSAPVQAAAMKPLRLELKSGQSLTFAATIADGKVTLGPARLGKAGEAKPGDGEMTVSVSPKDKTLYENVTVEEKTTKPIDFVATGFVGEVKIDEIVLHGRLDAPVSARIGAVSWTVLLNSFEPASEAAAK